MKTITVSVDETGTIKIDVTGFKGQGCEKLTAELEKALGVSGKRQRKPDFYQHNEQGQALGQ
jgi:hypothetical protein